MLTHPNFSHKNITAKDNLSERNSVTMQVISIAVLVLFVGLACAKPQDKYTTKYDNIDLDEILKSDRLLKSYVNCLMERGPCTPDGEELKKVLPDALHTRCSKCNDKQKDGSKKVIRFLIQNKRQWWDELEAKYDPDHKYRVEYEDELKKENIKF